MSVKAAVPTPDNDKAAIEWLRSNAVTFADTSPTPVELRALIEKLGNARIVGIGEATHGDHQDQTFKAELIKAMIVAGRIDTVALECSRQAGADFDTYARSGKGDLAALIRSKRFFRIWQDDEMAGLILWIRAWNATTTSPVRIIGIDNQDGIRDIAFALDFVRARDLALAGQLSAGVAPMLEDKAQALKFYKWVLATPKPEFDMATKGVQAVLDTFASHRSTWSSVPGYEDAERAARLAAQSLKEFELEAGNPDVDLHKLPAEYNNRRDVFMAANLIERSAGGHQTAIWAHDLHIIPDLDSAQRASGFLTMGSELRRQLGSEYVSIGFAWTEGSFNFQAVTSYTATELGNTDLTPQTLPNNRPQDLGNALSATNLQRFWIDLRAIPAAILPWAQTPRFGGWAGYWGNPAEWHSTDEDKFALVPGFDFLVYFRTITPSHLWKKAPSEKP
jgi:erythromycin esterase